MKLNTSGHYSYQNVCQAAWVVFVDVTDKVNVAGFNHQGDWFRRENVPVGPIDGEEGEFHTSEACPWNR